MGNFPKGIRAVICITVCVIAMMVTLIGLVLGAMHINLFSSKEDDFHKNMNCYTMESSDGPYTKCLDIGMDDYPYKNIKNSGKLCNENATAEDILFATQFSDPKKVQEIFANNSRFILDLASGLLVCFILQCFIWLPFEGFLLFFFFFEVRLGLLFRLFAIFQTFYWAFYWAISCSSYYLALSIQFGNCIQMKNPKEIDYLLKDEKFWLPHMIIGIIYPCAHFLLLLVSFIAAPSMQKKHLIYIYILGCAFAIPVIIMMGIQFDILIQISSLDSIENLSFLWIFLFISSSRVILAFLPDWVNYTLDTIYPVKNMKEFPGIDYEAIIS